jgi:HEAT repeat protein
VPALCRGLGDPDVQVRRNVALFLGVAGGDWYDRGRPRLAIEGCVPALVEALADSDSRVKELAAQAVGATGDAGVPAVPVLIGLLASPMKARETPPASGWLASVRLQGGRCPR